MAIVITVKTNSTHTLDPARAETNHSSVVCVLSTTSFAHYSFPLSYTTSVGEVAQKWSRNFLAFGKQGFFTQATVFF